VKTLKAVRSSGNYFDFVVNGSGSLSYLSSDTLENRDAAIDQRIVKAMLSGPYPFEPNYGAGLKSLIGQKKTVLSALDKIRSLNSFFSKYSTISGPLSITAISAILKDSVINVSVSYVSGRKLNFSFEKGNNSG
jgi:hypothetical protein